MVLNDTYLMVFIIPSKMICFKVKRRKAFLNNPGHLTGTPWNHVQFIQQQTRNSCFIYKRKSSAKQRCLQKNKETLICSGAATFMNIFWELQLFAPARWLCVKSFSRSSGVLFISHQTQMVVPRLISSRLELKWRRSRTGEVYITEMEI